MSGVTHLLDRVEQGDPKAAEELLPLVYEELRKLAAAKMAHQAPGQTLQATALVHEAYLRLTGGGRDQWQDRAHFFRAAAVAMRCILIENARSKSRWKRGGGLERVQLEGLELAADTPPDTLLVVNEALERLAAEDASKAELVRLRFFIGLTNAEAAKVLGLSEPTVKRYWDFARAWLLREIRAIAAGGWACETQAQRRPGGPPWWQGVRGCHRTFGASLSGLILFAREWRYSEWRWPVMSLATERIDETGTRDF